MFAALLLAATLSTPFQVVAEVDRLAVRDLWPGFDPRTVPVAIYDGTNTYLFRHPSPPVEFRPLPDQPGVRAFTGRYPGVVANTSSEIGGVKTATVSDLRPNAAPLLVHEMFHVFQRTHHPKWSANEADLFLYPITDAAVAASLRAEEEALKRALAGKGTRSRCWARAALAERQERFARITASSAAYERATELNEGLAAYVEHRAAVTPDARLTPSKPFAPNELRKRAYTTGAVLGRLLDRFSPRWRSELDTQSLDELLAAALAKDRPCSFIAAERAVFERDATSAVAAIGSERAAHRASFLAAPGWTLEFVVAAELLGMQGFDPLNVELVTPAEILHSRFVRFGNASGTVEVLGRAALSESAGAHPLFAGIRKLVLTGFATEPRVEEKDGAVTIGADGVKATFRNATVERTGSRIVVKVR